MLANIRSFSAILPEVMICVTQKWGITKKANHVRKTNARVLGRANGAVLTDPSWSVSTKKGPDHIQRPEKVCKKDRKALSPQPSPVKQKMKMSANFHVPIKKTELLEETRP